MTMPTTRINSSENIMPEYNSKVAELLALDNETRTTSIQKLSDEDASDILKQIFTKILKYNAKCDYEPNNIDNLNDEEKDRIASGLGIDQNDLLHKPILSNSSSTLTSQARLIRVLDHLKEKQLRDFNELHSYANIAADVYLQYKIDNPCLFSIRRLCTDREDTAIQLKDSQDINEILKIYSSLDDNSWLKTLLRDTYKKTDDYVFNWIAYNRDNIDDKFTEAFKAWNTVLDEWGRNKTSFQEYIPLYSKNNDVSFTPIEMLIAVRIQKKAAEGKIAKLASIEGCYKYHWEDVITDSTELNGKSGFKVYKKEPYEVKLKQAGISQFEKEILSEFCRNYNTEHTAIGCAGNKPHYNHPCNR